MTAAATKTTGYEAQISALSFLIETDGRFQRVQAKNALPANFALIGVRPNLNTPKGAPAPVQTIHKGNRTPTHRDGKGFWNNTVLAYAPFVVLRNAFFNVHPEAQRKIALGATTKYPMASVDGEYCAGAEFSAAGIEIRFNPKIHRTFVDGAGRAVKGAAEACVFGNRVFARGKIIYFAI